MTDQVQSLVVELDGDYRTDDVQPILDAIRMVKGVNNVHLGDPISLADRLTRTRVGKEYYDALIKVLHNLLKGKPPFDGCS